MFRIKQNKIIEYIFSLIWIFYSSYYVLFVTSALIYNLNNIIESVKRLCSLLTIIMLIMLLIFEFGVKSVWSRSQIKRICIFLLIIILVEIRISDLNLLLLALFVILAQSINLDRLLRFDIKLKFILLFVVFGMYLVGITENITGMYKNGYKQGFGFAHANSLAGYIFTLLVEILCVKYRKMRIHDWIIVVTIAAIISNITKSRTSEYAFIVTFILYIISNYLPKMFRNNIFKGIIRLSPLIFALISFLEVYGYSKGSKFAIAVDYNLNP